MESCDDMNQLVKEARESIQPRETSDLVTITSKEMISCNVNEAFNFVIDSENTPLFIDSLALINSSGKTGFNSPVIMIISRESVLLTETSDYWHKKASFVVIPSTFFKDHTVDENIKSILLKIDDFKHLTGLKSGQQKVDLSLILKKSGEDSFELELGLEDKKDGNSFRKKRFIIPFEFVVDEYTPTIDQIIPLVENNSAELTTDQDIIKDIFEDITVSEKDKAFAKIVFQEDRIDVVNQVEDLFERSTLLFDSPENYQEKLIGMSAIFNFTASKPFGIRKPKGFTGSRIGIVQIKRENDGVMSHALVLQKSSSNRIKWYCLHMEADDDEVNEEFKPPATPRIIFGFFSISRIAEIIPRTIQLQVLSGKTVTGRFSVFLVESVPRLSFEWDIDATPPITFDNWFEQYDPELVTRFLQRTCSERLIGDLQLLPEKLARDLRIEFEKRFLRSFTRESAFFAAACDLFIESQNESLVSINVDKLKSLVRERGFTIEFTCKTSSNEKQSAYLIQNNSIICKLPVSDLDISVNSRILNVKREEFDSTWRVFFS
ncbi:MAG: hypothetical protein ACFFD4_24280 [Candidatus Odinarchaeota archaeon]